MTTRIRPELGGDVREPRSLGAADGEIATDGWDVEDATTVGAGAEAAVTLGPLEVEQAAAITRLRPQKGQDVRLRGRRIGRARFGLPP
jgi:hypothetical protein